MKSLPVAALSARHGIDISNCEEGMWPFGLDESPASLRSCSASMVMRVPRGSCVTGLYRDRGWVVGSSVAAADHAGHRS